MTGNYTKFVIDRNGQAVKRLKPGFDPLEAESDIRLLLVSLLLAVVEQGLLALL